MSLFPLISAPDVGLAKRTALPLCREVSWDFVRDEPIFRGGEPVWITGAGAVLVWAWNALHTERFAHDIFSHDYGQDLSSLIGRPYSDEIRQSEAVRCVRETLGVNPYITAVDQIGVSFSGATLRLSCRITTIYGEVSIHGTDVAL